MLDATASCGKDEISAVKRPLARSESMTSSGVCSPSERVSGTFAIGSACGSAVERMPSSALFPAKPRLRTVTRTGHARARPDVAGSIDVGDRDVSRNSLVAQSDDVHRHAQRHDKLGPWRRAIQASVAAAVGKDEDAERQAVAESAGKLLECPIQPGFIGCRAQGVVEIGKSR